MNKTYTYAHLPATSVQNALRATPIPIWCFNRLSDSRLSSFHNNSQGTTLPRPTPRHLKDGNWTSKIFRKAINTFPESCGTAITHLKHTSEYVLLNSSYSMTLPLNYSFLFVPIARILLKFPPLFHDCFFMVYNLLFLILPISLWPNINIISSFKMHWVTNTGREIKALF